MKTLSSVLLLSFMSSLAGANVLVDQTSIPIGNPNMGNTAVASTIADVIIQESQAWDNFVITEPVNITELHWSGAYFNAFNPDGDLRGDTDFRIEFLPNLPSNAPDLSESALIAAFDLEGGTAGRNDGADVRESILPNQSTREGGAIVRYEADLASFELDPGSYWLSIQARQILPSNPAEYDDPEWAWVISEAGDDTAYSYDELFDPVGSHPGVEFQIDTAFTLFGDSLVTQLPGDFDDNGLLEAVDIDLLADAVRSNSNDSSFDLTGDGTITIDDHTYWVETLKGTYQGDATLNGVVAFDDFVALAANFGTDGGWSKGNFDTNETVDFGDFLKLSTNFGRGPTAAAAGEPVSAASVPEPSALLGLCIGGLLAFGMRRRRNFSVSVHKL